MKKRLISTLLLAVSLLAPVSHAKELNVATVEELINQVRMDAQKDREVNKEREAEFLNAHAQRAQMLAEVKAALAAAEKKAETLRQQFDSNEKALTEKRAALKEEAAELNDIFTIARQNANELQSLVTRSMVTAQFPERGDLLKPIIESNNVITFPQLKSLWLFLLEEMNQTRKVAMFDAPVISAQGEETNARVMRIGGFTATTEGNYLRYLPETGQLLELARQPAGNAQSLAFDLQAATDGQAYAMAVDPTKGSILALLVRSPDVVEQIEQGGVIGYLILIFGAIGLLVAFYRFIWLALMKGRVVQQAEGAEANANNPLGRLLMAAEGISHKDKEALAMRLEENIQLETSRIKWGLASIALFAAITPLLGLLGTVTGMIETFQSISLFGTGDPKLMSGGISQALVTTQLGLAVAIPLLLIHTFLNGKAVQMVELLESQSVRLFEDHDEVKPSDR